MPRQSPDRHRRRADQIGAAPPFQRGIALLPAEKQQHGPEQRRDHGRDDIKRDAVERHFAHPSVMQSIQLPRMGFAPFENSTLEGACWYSVVTCGQVFGKTASILSLMKQ